MFYSHIQHLDLSHRTELTLFSSASFPSDQPRCPSVLHCCGLKPAPCFDIETTES